MKHWMADKSSTNWFEICPSQPAKPDFLRVISESRVSHYQRGHRCSWVNNIPELIYSHRSNSLRIFRSEGCYFIKDVDNYLRISFQSDSTGTVFFNTICTPAFISLCRNIRVLATVPTTLPLISITGPPLEPVA